MSLVLVAFHFQTHVGLQCAHPGGGSQGRSVWKKQVIGLKEGKEPEGTGPTNDLSTSSLFSSSGVARSILFWVCVSALLLMKPFLCVLSHFVVGLTPNNKPVPAFTISASVRNAFSLRQMIQENSFQPQPLLVWWLGFLVLSQATQVQFLGRELGSHFTPLLTAVLLRLYWSSFIIRMDTYHM